MRSIQCKGCDYHIPHVKGCCINQKSVNYFNGVGSIEQHWFYIPISYIKNCEHANNGKGGVDNRCVT